ncbi:hypothetical protein [Bacillus sp. NEAU-Y102]
MENVKYVNQLSMGVILRDCLTPNWEPMLGEFRTVEGIEVSSTKDGVVAVFNTKDWGTADRVTNYIETGEQDKALLFRITKVNGKKELTVGSTVRKAENLYNGLLKQVHERLTLELIEEMDSVQVTGESILVGLLLISRQVRAC